MSCSSSSGSEDDEGIDSYRKGGYHAVRIGDHFAGGRYVAQRKLGWGQFSTVWLAYDTRTSVRFFQSHHIFHRFALILLILVNLDFILLLRVLLESLFFAGFCDHL